MSDPQLPLDTIAALAPRIRKKEVSPVEVTNAVLRVAHAYEATTSSDEKSARI